MFNQQDSQFQLVAQALHVLDCFMRLRLVHTCRRFIQQEQFRFGSQCARNFDAAFLRIGEVHHVLFLAIHQLGTKEAEEFQRAHTRLFLFMPDFRRAKKGT